MRKHAKTMQRQCKDIAKTYAKTMQRNAKPMQNFTV